MPRRGRRRGEELILAPSARGRLRRTVAYSLRRPVLRSISTSRRVPRKPPSALAPSPRRAPARAPQAAVAGPLGSASHVDRLNVRRRLLRLPGGILHLTRVGV